MPNGFGVSRRELLAGGAAAMVLGPSLAEAAVTRRSKRGRAIRFAHLTDVHVQPERAAGEGMAACLRHMQEQKDAPEFIVFGGDNVMNVDDSDAARAKVQLDLWSKVLKLECSLPYACAVGNHDVFGNHPIDGKKWAVDAYALPGRCYTLDRAGWRFVFLDSTFPINDVAYTAKLDDGQFEWLAAVLQQTKPETPICVVSHIPILSVSAYLCIEEPPKTDWQIPGSWAHIDAHRIKDLFKRYPNVKLCLSGHMHMVDSMEYLGVTYACNGAVSGNWWKGAYHEFDPKYALVDLYKDGSFDIEMVSYGWTPKA